MKRFGTRAVLILIAGLAVFASQAIAEDGEKSAWSDTAELSFVATDGNSESTSLGFKNTLGRSWDKSSLTFRAGGIRVESTTTTRKALGDPPTDPPDVVEESTTQTTAENYFFNGRYERDITDRFFWYSGVGWDRNEFAGIENRYLGEAGVGNIWFDRDDHKFKTNYALTFTDQEDLVMNPDPNADDTFLGARFSWDYLNKFGANTTYTNNFLLDDNLDETSDWRAAMDNGLSVAMSEKLAIKLGLLLLYDNEPSFENIDAVDTPAEDDVVPYQLDELDTLFTVSLVINFM